MSVDNAVKLIDAITKLLSVLIWPAMLLFILLRFGQDLRKLFSDLGKLSLKVAGLEVSLSRTQADATAALIAAEAATSSDRDITHRNAAKAAKIAADVVAEVVTPRVIRRASRSIVLWVDDRPQNNVYHRQALEALGMNFVLATSTNEALDKIARQRFDLIISDMGRPLDPRAGYTLLDKLRSSGDHTPFIIYANSRDPKHVAESRRHGAIGCTNNANELFEMVLLALDRVV